MPRQRTAIFSLLDTPAFGGAEQYMFSHLYFLQRQGYEIILATNNEKVKKEILSRLSEKERKTFHVIKAPYLLDAIGNWKGLLNFFLSLPSALSWCFFTLQKLGNEYNQVICLWPGFSDRLVFSFLAKYLGLPLLWIEIGPLEPTFKHNLGFPRFLYRLTEKYPDHLFTTSLFTKKSILRNTRFVSDDITLVYPGTQIFTHKQITQYQENAKQWKKENNLQKTNIIGVVARIAHENEIDMVIKAFALFLKDTKSKITLLIIGDGPQRPELEALAKELQIVKDVYFAGFVTEEMKRTLLASSVFFIFPRAWDLDGFGMTTIEAMSLGLPVLTTNFGPQIEIVTDGKEGYKYKPHDSRDLAKYMKKMFQLKPDEIQSMRTASLERVQYFTDTHAQKMMLATIKKYEVK